jgi:hypothetical protein
MDPGRTTQPIDIRASDAERRQIITALQTACVEGRLTLDEYGHRVERALAARTRSELEGLLGDLPHMMTAPRSGGPGASSITVAVLGSARRSGYWRLADGHTVVSALGSCKLDLREARVSGLTTTVNIWSVLGSVDVIVPPGVEVELDVGAILGSRDMRLAGSPPAPGAPTIRMTGAVLLGSLTIRDAASSAADPD